MATSQGIIAGTEAAIISRIVHPEKDDLPGDAARALPLLRSTVESWEWQTPDSELPPWVKKAVFRFADWETWPVPLHCGQVLFDCMNPLPWQCAQTSLRVMKPRTGWRAAVTVVGTYGNPMPWPAPSYIRCWCSYGKWAVSSRSMTRSENTDDGHI